MRLGSAHHASFGPACTSVAGAPRWRRDTDPVVQRGHLNPRLLEADTGKAFPRLVYELLTPDRPDLVLLDALGKDGAIDLSETRGDGRTVVECKHVGVDGPQAATVR